MKEEQFEEIWLKVVGEEIQAQQEKSIKRTQGIASKCVCYVGGFYVRNDSNWRFTVFIDDWTIPGISIHTISIQIRWLWWWWWMTVNYTLSIFLSPPISCSWLRNQLAIDQSTVEINIQTNCHDQKKCWRMSREYIRIYLSDHSFQFPV